jgi:hypothetical protein
MTAAIGYEYNHMSVTFGPDPAELPAIRSAREHVHVSGHSVVLNLHVHTGDEQWHQRVHWTCSVCNARDEWITEASDV